MSESDGGAAFPTMEFERVGEYVHSDIVHPGMTLRDWFAGKALQGMLSNGIGLHWSEGIEPISLPEFGEESYRFADAMLKAREAK